MHSFKAVAIILACISNCSSFPQSDLKDVNTTAFAHQNVLAAAPVKSNDNNTETLSSPSALILKESNSSESAESSGDEYSFEIETDSREEVIRQKLCTEESGTGKSQLYDIAANKCSGVGEQGHCGTNMIFLPEINSTIFGYCECNFGKSSLPLVFHNKTKMCHPIYTQAFCHKHEWLVFNKENRPICEPAMCDNNGKTKKTLKVPLNGTGPCVKLNSPSSHCPNGEIVHIAKNKAIPTCGVPVRIPSPRLLSPISQRTCPPGSFLSISGKCIGSWSW